VFQSSKLARAAVLAGALVALAVAAPVTTATAQDAKVYSAAEVTEAPKVKSPAAAQSAIERSFPSGLRSVGGRVQLRFVVEPSGKVDAASVEVIVASVSQLGEAAKKAIQGIEFVPGKVDGRAVRTIVQFPIVYASR
jgi:TonB family protein